jgi:hypothetical protein
MLRQAGTRSHANAETPPANNPPVTSMRNAQRFIPPSLSSFGRLLDQGPSEMSSSSEREVSSKSCLGARA